ncbi:MAG: recombinase family protein [Asticcacaulis sp.]|uniref:recombinase family protein n=1 Tax=Asticcacaulis sp. TaxID=1872648 RepID=UPI003F7BEA1E
MLIGYARVSKSEVQDAASQVDALKAAGCAKAFEETFSGCRWDLPQFNRMLDELRSDDVVIVSGLDHLASSLVDLIPMSEKILRRDVKIRAMSEPVEI